MSKDIFEEKKDKSSMMISIIGMLIIIAVIVVAFLNAGVDPDINGATVDVTGAIVKEKSVSTNNEEIIEGESSKNEMTAIPVSEGEISYKQTTIDAELLMQEYTLTISEGDIDISAQHVTLVASDFEMTVDVDKVMHLKSFNGMIMWKNSQLLLDGQLYKHLADYFEINWKNPTDIKLRIEEGFLSMESMAIDNLEVLASGSITIGDEMQLDLKDKTLKVNNYEGGFKSAVTGLKNTVNLDGTITEFSTDISNMKLDLG